MADDHPHSESSHLRSRPAAPPDGAPEPRRSRLVRAARIAGVVLFLVALLFLVQAGWSVLFLVFAGILVAIALRLAGDLVRRVSGMPQPWALLTAVVLLIALGVGIGFLVAPRVAHQADQLSEELPRAVDQLTGHLERWDWGRTLVERARNFEIGEPGGPNILSRATGIASTVFGAVTNFFIILFLGIYMSVAPGTYVGGLVRLFPPRKRDRARQILDEIGENLRHWLAARLIAMVIVGVLTWAGLALLGIELAFLLSVLAAVLTFIPNFGPVVSAIPAILLGLTQSPMMGLWVALLYLGVQTVESYLITPNLMHRAISVPPALLLTLQIFLGLVAGFLGFLLADALSAALVILVQRLWIEGALGDEPALPDDD